MNVTSLSGASSILSTDEVQSSQGVSGLTDLGGSETTGVSKMADLMSQLQSLQDSDPEQFQKVMSAIAEQLQKEAGSSDGARAAFLTGMASKFTEAAQSGDLSVLKPPPPPDGSPPPPASSSSTTASSDKVKAAYAASSAQAPGDDLEEVIQSVLAQYRS